MPRFAANISLMFGEWSFPDRFAAAADAGFRHVECQFPYEWPAEQLAKAARAAGVDVALINLPPGDFAGGERGLACVEGAEARFRDAIDRGIDYAEALGAPVVHVMSGNGDPRDAATVDRFRRNLTLAADLLTARGIRTVIEPINPWDMPGYLLGSYALAEQIARDRDGPPVGLLFDIYHRQRMAGDVSTALKRLLPLIEHVQVAGVPGRHEPTGGELDFPYLFGLLDRLPYAGIVGCEYHPAAGTVAGLDWIRSYQGDI